MPYLVIGNWVDETLLMKIDADYLQGCITEGNTENIKT